MQILTAIDAILKSMPVRWGLLVAAILLTIICFYQKGNLYITSLQLEAAEGRGAKLTASLSAQNAAVKKAGEDMQAAKKRLEEANSKVSVLRKQLEKRKTEIVEVILHGDCPDMVQQVLDEVRK